MEKICKNCKKLYPTEKTVCPKCGEELIDSVNYYGVEYHNGDKSAFDKILLSTQKTVGQKVSRLIPNIEDQQDCMQDIYIKLYKNIHSFDPEKSDFRVWFNELTINCIRTFYKKVKKNTEYTDYIGEETEKLDNPEARLLEYRFEMQQQDKIELINQILASIPENQRICIVQYYFGEKKQKEIAEELGISIKTVDSRIRLGKKAVEEKVVELEKKEGIKLYTLTPFLLFLLLGREVNAAELDLATAKEAIKEGQPIKKTESKSTKTTTKSKFLTTAAGKATVGVTAALVVIGGGYALVSNSKQDEKAAFAHDQTEDKTKIEDDESISFVPRKTEEPSDEASEEVPEETKEENISEETSTTDDTTQTSDSLLPGDYPLTFKFSSGAGGWGTELRMNADGTFDGYYYDYNGGEVSDDYPYGTQNFSKAKGSYYDVQQINETTYSFTISELSLYGEEDSGVKDGTNYSYSSDGTFPGFDSTTAGSKMLYYLTGTSMEEIPEECILWLFNPDADSDGKLDYNVIYNEEGQEGFSEADLYYMR